MLLSFNIAVVSFNTSPTYHILVVVFKKKICVYTFMKCLPIPSVTIPVYISDHPFGIILFLPQVLICLNCLVEYFSISFILVPWLVHLKMSLFSHIVGRYFKEL